MADGAPDEREDAASGLLVRPGGFGVGARLIGGLALIVTLAVAISGLSLYVFGRLDGWFDSVSARRLPSLVAADELARQVESVVANAPNLAAAHSDFDQDTIARRLADQMAWLTAGRQRIAAFGVDSTTLALLDALTEELTANIEHLNRNVSRRNAAERRLAREVARAVDLHESSIRLETDASDSGAMEEWGHAVQSAIVAMLAAVPAGQPQVRLFRAKAERHLAVADAALARVTGPMAGPAERLTREAVALGVGEDSVFAARLAVLAAEETIAGALFHNKEIADRVTDTATRLALHIREEVERDNAQAQEMVDWLSRLLVGGAAAAAMGGVLVFIYISRHVVRRLERLSRAMAACIEGEPSRFDTRGNDEISRMGQALAFFVSELGRREEDLRAAKTRAEVALEDRQRMERQLVESEKMAALGGLVAGFAHELNTPLGTAVTAASHLAQRTEATRRAVTDGTLRRADFVEFMETAAEASALVLGNVSRSADMVQSFKRVAVDQTVGDRRRFDLRRYLEEVLTSLHPRLRRLAHPVAVDCPEGLIVDTYAGALAQIVSNLVVNALFHAYGPDDKDGRMAITVRAPSEDMVELVFCDDGAGIPPEHVRRVFDPFFTTKRGSGGTGLGLHIVYNLVVQRLGGIIRCDSAPGKGATFTILFPRAAPANPCEAEPAPAS